VFKVLNPCVCETLPRETLAEGVAAKHAGNEETERGEDRADCVSEYCLLAKIFEGVSGNGSNTSIINKLWPHCRLLLLHASVQSRVGRTRPRRASKPAITLSTSASSASLGVYGKGEGVGRDAPTEDTRPAAQCG